MDDDLRRRLPIGPGSRARALALWLVAAGAYIASIEASDAWTLPGRYVPVLWLPTGVGYALVAVGGRRYAAPVAAATLLEGILEGRGPLQSAVLAIGAALSALAIVETVRRAKVGGERLLDTAIRFASGVPGAAIGATATLLAAAPATAPGRLWFDAFAAQVVGVVIAGPFLRAWLERHSGGPASRRELLAILAVAAALAELVGSGVLDAGSPGLYLLFPPLIWAALRTGRRGTSAALLVTTAVLASNLTAGRGPFAHPGDAALGVDLFLWVGAFGALMLAGLEAARRGGEATLRDSEERFRALIDNSTDLVSVVARDGKILYESPSAQRIVGWRPEELVGRNIVDVVHPDDRQRLASGVRTVVSGIEAKALVRVRHKDGGWIELEGHARDLTDSPTVGGILVNSRDVTRTRRAEHDLADAERRYREFVESLPLVAYVNDFARADSSPQAGPRYVSPQVEELLGYPASAWLEDPGFAAKVVHPDDRDRLAPAGGQDGAEAVAAEYRMIAADGRVVWVLDRRRVLCGQNGEPAAVQGFLVDITDRKRLEEQLARAERMEALGQLAGGVAHDFNNLLTAILGYGELALGHAGDAERVSADLEQVVLAAHRASTLTRQLLAFGRRQALDHVVLDLNDVVVETEQLLIRLIDENVEIVSSLDPELGAVRADAGQLTQVLINLAVNARDAMPRGGQLTISTANETVADGEDVPPGEYAVVSVADTGVGIAHELHERLVEPFFTTKAPGKGTGLGLAVVYGIVEQSHGHLVVRSEPGRGAEFRVMLPRSDDVREDAEVEPDDVPRGTETVLLVEDEELVRRLTSAMLQRQGYQVLAAASPQEALAIAAPYDLVLTDVVMPGMSGPELVERLRSEHDAAVLFTSGYSAAAVSDRAALPGALLEKPFTLEDLARGVRGALDARR
jgi:PAS domain S-box-containing protein